MDRVGIANLALSFIGQRGTISNLDPPEGSEHAERAAQFFDLARDSLLERHSWSFTTRRALGVLVNVTLGGWSYTYAVPNDCIDLIAVLPEGYSDDYSDSFGIVPIRYGTSLPLMTGRYVPQQFVVESLEDGTPVVLTDAQNATLRYAVRVEDPTRWSALFVEAMSHQLAAMLAGAIIKGSEGVSIARTERQIVEALLGQAKMHDANQRNVRPQHQVPWLAAR